MKKNKILTLIMTFCLVFSIMTTGAFGAEVDSKEFEQAITYTKSIISIPSGYDDFDHNSRQEDTENGKITVWSLSWMNKDGGGINASVDSYGNLCNYNKYYDNYSNSKKLAKVTKSEAEKTAKEFLKKAIPDYCDNMRLIDSNNINYSEEYNFSYEEYVNDVPVSFMVVNVSVNKNTGEVTSYYGLNPGTKKLEYPSIDNIIDIQNAKKIYVDNVADDFKYNSYYDYKENKLNVFSSYSINDNLQKAIDAKTGQVVKNYTDYKPKLYYENLSDGLAGINSKEYGQAVKLSDAEIEAVKKMSQLITKEKAESILKENTDLIASDTPVIDTTLSKNSRHDSEYIWNINFDNGYCEVDAESGELKAFYSYTDNSIAQNISKDNAREIAEKFLKKICPNKLEKTKLIQKEDVETNNYEFNYIRQVNGNQFVNNSLNVSVNKSTGKIESYSNYWDNNIVFPDTTKAISKNDAFNEFAESEKFLLQYTLVDKNKVGLVYNFINVDNSYGIDALSGKKIDYRGKDYVKFELPEYKDISGHWCENTVQELLDNGYYIKGEKFNPDNNINQIDFLKYIFSKEQNYYNDEEFYNMLIDKGIIKDGEKNPSSYITNNEAAKIVIRYLGYDKLANCPEIFNSPFNDSLQTEYKSYAIMSYGLNIIKGDSKGNFNGNSKITNAQASVVLYNLLKIK